MKFVHSVVVYNCLCSLSVLSVLAQMFSCFSGQVVPVDPAELGQRVFTRAALMRLPKETVVDFLVAENVRVASLRVEISELRDESKGMNIHARAMDTQISQLERSNCVLKDRVGQMQLEMERLQQDISELQYFVRYESGDLARSGLDFLTSIQPVLDKMDACLMDPISGKPFKRPVIISTGYTFEEAALSKKLVEQKMCPTTNVFLGHMFNSHEYYIANRHMYTMGALVAELKKAIFAVLNPHTREFTCQVEFA